MQITHVVRAEEHLSNTFPQLLVFEALGAALPAFAHVPYVAEPGSKAKMSKRKIKEYEDQGVLVYLHQYIERGYLPEALLNYLARLGWSYDASQEIFTRAELIEKFSLDRVNSSPASHDQDKLFWIEGEWMKALPLDRKIEGVLPYLQREGLVAEPLSDADRARIEAVILALGDRLKVFSDILKLGRFFFTTELTHDPDAVKKRLRKEGVPAMLAELDAVLAEVEPYDLATLEKAVHDYAERTGRKMGDVVNPLRVATTGQGVGPGLYDCLFILGRETCRARGSPRRWSHADGCRRASRTPPSRPDRPTAGPRDRLQRTTDDAHLRDRLDRLRLHHGLPGTVPGPHPPRQDARPERLVPGRFAEAAAGRDRRPTSPTTWPFWASGRCVVGTVGEDFAEYRQWLDGQGRRHRRAIKVIAGRAHGLVLHQHRPPGQPDHRLLSRGDGPGGDGLAPRPRTRGPTTW